MSIAKYFCHILFLKTFSTSFIYSITLTHIAFPHLTPFYGFTIFVYQYFLTITFNLPFTHLDSTITTMDKLASHISLTLKLPLVMDVPTPGKGNCFFAAVCQQIDHRPELGLQNVYASPAHLRRQVCEFALAKDNPTILNLAVQHDETAILTLRSPWDHFFQTMKRNGVFAEGPVLHCTALLLGLDIAVITLGNTQENPYFLISGQSNLQPPPPPIFLGNEVNMHFQSFLPKDAMQSTISTPTGEAHSQLSPSFLENDAIQSTPTTEAHLQSSPSQKLTPRKLKHSSLLGVRHMENIGDNIMQNIGMLVRENRRLHAVVQSLQFQLSSCECSKEVKQEEDFDSYIVLDSASDDLLSSTPL